VSLIRGSVIAALATVLWAGTASAEEPPSAALDAGSSPPWILLAGAERRSVFGTPAWLGSFTLGAQRALGEGWGIDLAGQVAHGRTLSRVFVSDLSGSGALLARVGPLRIGPAGSFGFLVVHRVTAGPELIVPHIGGALRLEIAPWRGADLEPVVQVDVGTENTEAGFSLVTAARLGARFLPRGSPRAHRSLMRP